MSLRNKLSDTLFRFLIGAVYAYALSWVILSATILEVDGAFLLRLCFLCSAVWSVLFWNKWTFLSGLGLALLVAGGAVLSLYRQDFEAAWWRELSALVRELYRFAVNQLPYRPEYSVYFAKGLAVLLTLLAALNLQVGSGFLTLTLLATGVCAVPLYMGWEVDENALVLLAFCLLVLLVHQLNLIAVLRDQYGEKSAGVLALLMLPVCAGIFLLAGSAPKPDVESLQNQELPDISGAADNLLYYLMPDQVFSWSEDGKKLGGPRHPNDTFVMEVSAPDQVYLAGSVHDIYTGSSWEKSRTGTTPLKKEAGLYHANAYGDLVYNQLYFMRYYAQPMEELAVITGDARTKTIFAPPFIQSLAIEDISPSMDEYGILLGDKPLPKEHTYTQTYIDWNFSNPYMRRVLQELSSGGRTAEDSQDEMLAACLSLPDTLPLRVKELALSLTQGLDSDYDKLVAIQNYLAQFPYTLDPENVPAGEDFVDYFLFTGREGYCVYYATAMAVLGRCADIPTRYVEGFVLPREKNVNGNYTVTNQQAHAWVEAWFPDFGWVKFDPTPPLGAGTGPEEPESSQPEEETEEESLPESSRPEEPPPSTVSEPEEPESSLPELPEEPNESETEPSSKGIGAFLWGLLAVLAAGGGLYLYGRHRINRYRQELEAIDALSNREAVIRWFERIVKALSALGYPIRQGETALTYAQRVEEALSTPEHPIPLWELAKIFCLASYSRQEITPSHREQMKECYRQLTARLEQAAKHKIFYDWKRYLLGKF